MNLITRFGKKALTLAWVGLILTGCNPSVPNSPQSASESGALAPSQAAQNFATVVDRVEPVAERICRAETRGALDCDFQINIVTDPNAPPNAFQSLDRSGRPQITFTATLIADARNVDELAFILGHEAAHHIAGHIPRSQRNAVTGGLVLGALIGLGGGDATTVDAAVRLGAQVGARRFSKEFELEADRLGTIIADAAGYDPVRGAAYFNRIPDPGDRFLGSHPPNAERIEIVRRTAAGL